MKHTIVLEFETDKPIPEMLDLIAGRVYSLDRVVKGQVVATTLANYLYDVRKRVDVKPLEVRERPPFKSRFIAEQRAAAAAQIGGWRGPMAGYVLSEDVAAMDAIAFRNVSESLGG